MNRKEFYEYIKNNVKNYLPQTYENAEIKLQEIAKNNGVNLTAITIPEGTQRAVPSIYLDSMYQDYLNGKPLDSCVGDVGRHENRVAGYGSVCESWLTRYP